MLLGLHTKSARHGATARQQPEQLQQKQAKPPILRYQRFQAPRRAIVASLGGSGGPCVDIAWLKRNLEDVRVYDARGRVSEPDADYDAYLEGHIPGAVFVSWVRDGAAWQPRGCGGGAATVSSGGGVSGDEALAVVVDPEVYVPCFEARGLSAERPVVVYDNGTSMIAARVWWQLLLYGHPSPYVLHGGWEAWRSAGGGLELYEPCPLKLSSVYDAELQLRYRAMPEEFRLAATRRSADGDGDGEPAVAVLLVPDADPQTPNAHHPHQTTSSSSAARAAGSGGVCIEDLPLARRVSLPTLLRACIGTGSNSSSGAGGGGGSPPPWTTAALALAAAAAGNSGGGGEAPRAALAARLAAALGTPVGPGSPARLLLSSPHDAALSACAAGALLHAAGHERWAVCEAW